MGYSSIKDQMMQSEDQFSIRINLILNYLPVTLSNRQLSAMTRVYTDNSEYDALREQVDSNYFLRRYGEKVYCISTPNCNADIDGDIEIITTKDNAPIFQYVLKEGIRTLLLQQYKDKPDYHISSYGDLIVTATGTPNDLLKPVLEKNAFYPKLSFLHVYRKYNMDIVRTWDKDINDFRFGVLIRVGTKWRVGATLEELIAKGIDLKGCYVVPVSSGQEFERGNKIAGSIVEIRNGQARLGEYRDQEFVDAKTFTIEASLENINRCSVALLGNGSSLFYKQFRSEVGKLLRADGQQSRIIKIADSIGKNSIECAKSLSITVEKQPIHISNSSLFTATTFTPPNYVLRIGGASVAGPIATALASQGPIDRDNFSKTTPHVLIITPKQMTGVVEQYVGTWMDGNIDKYRKGFVAQYKLRGWTYKVIDFSETENPAEDYRDACERALIQMRDDVKKYDLAIIVIKESYRRLGANDPYLIAKANLMNQGIPVQEIEIETIEQPVDNPSYIYNNLGLASYAKMGGTPWTLASTMGKGITHELIMGIGFSVVRYGRLQEQERFVGITTLFDYDGRYRLSNLTRDLPIEEYSEGLRVTLDTDIKYVSAEKGWQNGDRVRLIFHTCKPLNNLEIAVVKKLVVNNLPDYEVDFAFLEISQFHDWTVFDPDSQGYQPTYGNVRGKEVPKRGTVIYVGERRALLSVTGPKELKTEDQGCPAPLQLTLHRDSTFTDIKYLANQVFNFTHMSWKTFNTLTMPVTIEYSQAIARLLGRMRGVKNWNADALRTTQLRKSLWFL
jgi:hypothetical protein